MSRESIAWLNTMTLIGYTDQRGNAWHYKASEQGSESNHYPGAIPVEDVRRRLFGWKVVEGDVSSTATVMNADGVHTFTITDPDRKSMLRPPGAFGPNDPGAMLGLFKIGYAGHDYEEWLLNTVASILDDELQIGSGGLLRQGAQAFVSVEVPDTIVTPEGVQFRPHLLATTSFDGSLATSFKRVVTNVVCDNTMAAGLAEHGQQFKVKHSRYSGMKLAEARQALEIVHTVADDFAAEVAKLTSERVSDHDYQRFLDIIAPLQKEGEALTGRSLTMATNKQDEMRRLWNTDTRVAPWKNTAWGVVQAVNTHTHHIQTVRGAERAERNMTLAVTGAFDKLDTDTYDVLQTVLA